MSSIVGASLDDLVGNILAKKGDQSFLAQVDKEFLDTEIKLLKGRVDSYKAAEAEQVESSKGLNEKLEQEKADQKDIFMYLNGELAKKTDEILDLQKKMQELIEENEKMALEHEQRMLAQRDAAQLSAAKLHEDLANYKDKLSKVEKFIEQKKDMEAALAEKARRIEADAEAFQTQISDLERKHVQEKDRLKTEMLYKLRETKANLLKMTDNQLDTTTKRTIAENEQMSSELAWQSKETEKLIRKNDKMVAENASLRRELSLQKSMQEEFARKVNVYQKTIQTLMSKLSSAGAEHESELLRRDLAAEDMERDRSETLHEREMLETQLTDANEMNAASEERCKGLEAALQEVEAKHSNVLMLQGDAVKFTLQCLDDVRVRVGGVTLGGKDVGTGGAALDDEGTGGAAPAGAPSLRTLDANQREAVLGYLLEQLRSYQEQLKELELHHAWKAHTTTVATQPLAPTSLPPIHSPGAKTAVGQAVWSVGPPPQAGGGDAMPLPRPGSGDLYEVGVREGVRPWGRRVKQEGHMARARGY